MPRNPANHQQPDRNKQTDPHARGGARADTSAARPADKERTIQTNQERGAEGRTGLARRQNTRRAGSGIGANASPFMLMRRMAEDMDHLLNDFAIGRSGFDLTPFWRTSPELAQTTWSPQVETFRRGDQLVVRADLPGLKKEDVNVEAADGVLTISGERCEQHENDRDGYYRSERSYGEFYRSIPLPEGVTGDQCEATFKDGVLEVTLPAPKEIEAAKGKRIPIR